MSLLLKNSTLNHLSSFIHSAIEVAQKSPIDQQLAAGILVGKTPVSKIVCNTPQNICRGKCVGSSHAESNAIKEYLGKKLGYDSKRGWRNISTKQPNNKNKQLREKLCVIRVNKDGELANSRPCVECLKMMKQVGIRKVYYSVSADKIICENVRDMVSIQVATTLKHIDKLKGKFDMKDPTKYYEGLLLQYFPSSIKQYNLDHFITYNLLKVLPTYQYKIINKGKTFIILNEKLQVIISASIV